MGKLNVFNNPYALLILSNSLKMIQTDRNMSQVRWIICKIVILTSVYLFVLLYELSVHSVLYFIC